MKKAAWSRLDRGEGQVATALTLNPGGLNEYRPVSTRRPMVPE